MLKEVDEESKWVWFLVLGFFLMFKCNFLLKEKKKNSMGERPRNQNIKSAEALMFTNSFIAMSFSELRYLWPLRKCIKISQDLKVRFKICF